MDDITLEPWLEALLMSSKKPIPENQILEFWPKHYEALQPTIKSVRKKLLSLQDYYSNRAVGLFKLASGWQFLVKADYGPLIMKLWDEKPLKYSRAMLETLALIAYRQPITRGEIEEVRGVSVNTAIIKTLLEEKAWIRIVGHRAVPGKPALFATTKEFLDYFGLKTLEELPLLPNHSELNQSSIQNIEIALQEKIHALNT